LKNVFDEYGTRDFDVDEIDFGVSKDVEIMMPKDIQKAKRKLMKLKGPVYVSIDIDALDPSIAPSVSVPVPMGLTMKNLLTLLDSIPKPLGFDIVELACKPNKSDRTSMAAAYILREYMPMIYFD